MKSPLTTLRMALSGLPNVNAALQRFGPEIEALGLVGTPVRAASARIERASPVGEFSEVPADYVLHERHTVETPEVDDESLGTFDL